MRVRQASEKGQVLVILTFGIIALLGFAALAVDGGMLYADRRYDQNSADNAALAGAGAAAKVFNSQGINLDSFNCDDADVDDAIAAAYTAVETSAAEFNLAGDHDISDGHGVLVECTDDGGETGNYLLITIKLTSTTNTAFAQLIFSNELQNTVQAVTRIEPGVQDPDGPSANGAGLVGLSEDCDDATAMLFDGTVKVIVATGGVHSNSCMEKKGTSGYIVTETGSEYRTGFSGHTSPFCLGTSYETCEQTDPQETSTLVELHVDAPNCADLDEKTFNKKSTGITPGRYTNVVQPNGSLTFAPGLYCFEAGAKFSGNNAISVSGDSEDGVTIYVTGGDFAIGGSIDMNLRAPRQSAANSGLAIPGMLFYTPEDYTGKVSFLGNADSFLRGTVFVPAGDLDIGGSSYTSDWSAQMLGNHVKVHGSTVLQLKYVDDDLYWDEGELSLPLLDVYQ